MTKSAASGKNTTKQGLQRVRRQLHDAATFVRAQEVTTAISRYTFNNLLATQIRELVGDEGSNIREVVTMYDGGKEVEVPVRKAKIYGRRVITAIDRITAMENTIHTLVTNIKKIDPGAIVAALSQPEEPNAVRAQDRRR